MTRLALAQRSDAWLEARRSMVTATDIPVLLGLSPYKCEADLADEKLTGVQSEPSIQMRVGQAVESIIGEEYAKRTGRSIRAFAGMAVHDELPWAAASPDFEDMDGKRLVEAKSWGRRWDEIPQHIEAQVVWQLGVTGYPVADIAVLVNGRDFDVYEDIPANPTLFADLVAIAEDFRRRLAAGGPFARDADRIKRDHPTDNGAEMEADPDLSAAVQALLDVRTRRKTLEASEEAIEAAIKERMGDYAVLRGQGFHITWKRTKDREETDWKSVATGLLTTLPETEAEALVGIATTVRSGFRPFRVVLDKED